MSVDKDIIETRKDAEGRNKNKIFCTFCPSKMLNAGVARLINMEVSTMYFEHITLLSEEFAIID